jgi:hypothetical protein
LLPTRDVTIILSPVVQMALAPAMMFAMLALALVGGVASTVQEWTLDPDRRMHGDEA